MQPYHHFTLTERQNLHDKLAEKKNLRTIAKEMNRNVSSVSRELARNRNKDGTYNAWRGCCLYIVRRQKSRRQYRIQPDTPLYEWIMSQLTIFYPPETIVVTWKQNNPGEKLSHNTIYRAIKELRITGIEPKINLRRHGQGKKTHKTATIQPENYIKDRPDIINNRERLGDWEGDTVHGATGKGGIVTCVERKSRYLVSVLIPNYQSKTTNQAMKQALKGLPVHSITLDNGSEFAEFKDLSEDLHTTVYFADPHSPWQRGTNENINDLVRFFFPKGTNFHGTPEEKLNWALSLINNRPRKCLGWLSPAQILFGRCCT